MKKSENVEKIFDNAVLASSMKGAKPKKERNIQKLALAFIEDRTDMNFEKLVNRITWGLRGYIFKIVNDDTATTDVLSHTLENIYFKIDQFDADKGKFSTWMYKIARNNALKYNKDSKKSQTISVDYEDLYDSTVANETEVKDRGEERVTEDICDMVCIGGKWVTYDREQVIKEFYDASVDSIKYLPDNLKMVMNDRLVNQKKIEAIAVDNNVPITSVKNWLRKGKFELQGIIKFRYPKLYEMYKEIAL